MKKSTSPDAYLHLFARAISDPATPAHKPSATVTVRAPMAVYLEEHGGGRPGWPCSKACSHLHETAAFGLHIQPPSSAQSLEAFPEAIHRSVTFSAARQTLPQVWAH